MLFVANVIINNNPVIVVTEEFRVNAVHRHVSLPVPVVI